MILHDLTTKEFASLVGVSEQTIRNLDDVLPPNSHTVNGHRRYSYSQIFDYFRLENENALVKNDVKRVVALLHKDLYGLLLYFYLKSKFSTFQIEVLQVDELTSEECINRIASLGVLDVIYYLRSSDNIISRYPFVLKRLGIRQICIENSYGNEFKIFVRLFTCLSVYDLFLSQLDCYEKVLDEKVISFMVSNIRSCVKCVLSCSIFKDFSLKFVNIEFSNGDLIDTYEKLSDKSSDFEFCLDINGFTGFRLKKKLRSSILNDFLKLYHNCRRRSLDLYELISSSCYDELLKVDCLGG